MLKRFELHNHTLESDAGISCAELLAIMEADGVDAFAITDHNTISGHRILQSLLREGGHPIQCVYGMEYTTYYGHILCLNLHRYVPWDSINRFKPELLFEACREAGALTGVAHPFSYGDPFARGCRFEMTISDFSHVDFIEIMNNPEPMDRVNKPGLEWWEALTLRGEKLAATAGMDLHWKTDMGMKFATYLEGEPGGDAARELEAAVRSQRTWVSRGMILRWQAAGAGLQFALEDAKKPGFVPGKRYILTLKSASETREYEIPGEGLALDKDDLPVGNILIPKLYRDDTSFENLLCVAPVIRRSEISR